MIKAREKCVESEMIWSSILVSAGIDTDLIYVVILGGCKRFTSNSYAESLEHCVTHKRLHTACASKSYVNRV